MSRIAIATLADGMRVFRCACGREQLSESLQHPHGLTWAEAVSVGWTLGAPVESGGPGVPVCPFCDAAKQRATGGRFAVTGAEQLAAREKAFAEWWRQSCPTPWFGDTEKRGLARVAFDAGWDAIGFSADELEILIASVSYTVEVWCRVTDAELLAKLEGMRAAGKAAG